MDKRKYLAISCPQCGAPAWRPGDAVLRVVHIWQEDGQFVDDAQLCAWVPGYLCDWCGHSDIQNPAKAAIMDYALRHRDDKLFAWSCVLAEHNLEGGCDAAAG